MKPEDINDSDYDESEDEDGGEGEDSGVALDNVRASQEMQEKTPEKTPEKTHKQGVNVSESDTTLGTRQNMKQRMKLEESDTLHGSLAFREQGL